MTHEWRWWIANGDDRDCWRCSRCRAVTMALTGSEPGEGAVGTFRGGLRASEDCDEAVAMVVLLS